MRRSVIEFPCTVEYRDVYRSKVESAGLTDTMENLMGHANQIEGRSGTAAVHFRRAGITEEHNTAMRDVERTLAEILTHDKDNFMRALQLEALHIEKLLSSAIQRQHIVNNIHTVLKDMHHALKQKAELLDRLAFFVASHEEIEAESHYGLMVAVTILLKKMPEDTTRALGSEDSRQLQDDFESIFRHPRLSQELSLLLAVRVVYIAYLFGSHIAGYLIFDRDFMRSILAIMQNKCLSGIDPTDALQKRILTSIHEHLTDQD